MLPPVMMIGGIAVGLYALSQVKTGTTTADSAGPTPTDNARPAGLAPGDVSEVQTTAGPVVVANDGAGITATNVATVEPTAAPSMAAVRAEVAEARGEARDAIAAAQGCIDCGAAPSPSAPASTSILDATEPIAVARDADQTYTATTKVVQIEDYGTGLTGSRALAEYGPRVGALW